MRSIPLDLEVICHWLRVGGRLPDDAIRWLEQQDLTSLELRRLFAAFFGDVNVGCVNAHYGFAAIRGRGVLHLRDLGE